MSDSRRPVVLHYHLFKNAGSSVDTALKNAFGDRHGTLEGVFPWSIVSPHRMANFLADHPLLQAVSSHQARLPLPPLASIRALPVIFVRHPIDRFGSVYQYERQDSRDSLSPSAAIARRGDLRAFAEWATSSHATAVVCNYQTTHIAGIDGDMRMVGGSRFQLMVAIERLRALAVVGVVERFDESMARFARLIAADFPQFSGAYRLENVSHGRAGSLQQRLDEIREQVGEALYQKLEEVNMLDLQLYRDVLDRFEQSAGMPC